MAISKSKRQRLIMSKPNHCWYCGCDDISTIDHLKPQARGGSNELDNLVLCCKSCNSRKQHLSIEDFRFKISWLKTKYSAHVNHINAKKLIGQGVFFDGFVNDHKFWFEVI